MKITTHSPTTLNQIKSYIAEQKKVTINAVVLEDKNKNELIEDNEAEVITPTGRVSCAQELAAYRSLWTTASEQAIKKYHESCLKYSTPPQEWVIRELQAGDVMLEIFGANYQLDVPGINAISDSLNGYKFITKLWTNYLDLHLNGWLALAKLLENNQQIISITLSGKNICNISISYFLGNIQNNSQLRVVECTTGTMLNEAKVIELIKAVQQNQNIKEFYNGYTRHGNNSVQALIELARTHPSLTLLDITFTGLSEAEHNGFCAALKERRASGKPELKIEYYTESFITAESSFSEYEFQIPGKGYNRY